MARYGIRRETDGAWWRGAREFSENLWDAADFETFDLANATAEWLDPRPSKLSVALVPDRLCQRQTEALREAERFMSYFSGETDTFVGPGTPAECLAQIRAAMK